MCSRSYNSYDISLTVGSVCGAISELFTKIKTIDAKHGKFDFVLCTGDFFGPPKDAEDTEKNDEVMQLLEGKLEGCSICDEVQVRVLNMLSRLAAPLECFIMQGEHPLPAPVIEKFAKTGGALTKDVFLLRMLFVVLYQKKWLTKNHRQVRCDEYRAWATCSLPRRNI